MQLLGTTVTLLLIGAIGPILPGPILPGPILPWRERTGQSAPE